MASRHEVTESRGRVAEAELNANRAEVTIIALREEADAAKERERDETGRSARLSLEVTGLKRMVGERDQEIADLQELAATRAQQVAALTADKTRLEDQLQNVGPSGADRKVEERLSDLEGAFGSEQAAHKKTAGELRTERAAKRAVEQKLSRATVERNEARTALADEREAHERTRALLGPQPTKGLKSDG
jgi:hypothetical protein